MKQAPDTCDLTIDGVLQLSVAVGAVHCARAQLSKLVKTIFEGQLEKRGLMLSVAQGLITVTVNEQIDVLFLASVAV